MIPTMLRRLAPVVLTVAALLSTAVAQTPPGPPRDNPAARARHEQMLTRNPATNAVPAAIRARELAFASTLPTHEASRGAKGERTLQTAPWTFRGPSSIGGRTRAFALDVANENNLLAGGVSGGMWRSIDGGQSWVRTSRLDLMPSVTCIAQDTRPGRTNVWYYGTGEWRGSTSDVRGDGIFKSTDNGLTWNLLPSTSTGAPHTHDPFDFVWRIAVDPSRQDQDIIYAAVVGGIYRSADGGATWTLALGVADPGQPKPEATDVVVTSDGVVYATMSELTSDFGTSPISGIYRSTDGVNWTNITPTSLQPLFARIVPAVAPSDENIVYFLINSPFEPQPNILYRYTYLSGNGSGGGGQWANRSANLPPANDWLNGFDSQYSYNLSIDVSPADPDIVCIGGTNLFLSTNGFTSSWNTRHIGGYNPAYNYTTEDWINMLYPDHHSDIHDIVFLPSNPSVLFTAGDGGIHRTQNCMAQSVSWTPLNNGYATSQFYTVAINQYTSVDQTVIGGLQDNHTYGSPAPGAPWEWLAGGDGSFCAIPPDNSVYYVSAQSGYLCRSYVDENFRNNRIEVLSADTLQDNGFLFIAPFLLDPNNAEVMYLASIRRIWRIEGISGAGVATPWVSVASSPGTGAISSLQVSRQPAHVLYFGTFDGNVYRVDNAHLPPGQRRTVTGTNFPAGATVQCIAVDPLDADHAVVVFSNYEVPSLFATTDGGQSWTDVSGNLEENPNGSGAGPSCRWLEILHTPGGTVYLVGTSIGLFSTTHLNGGATQWVQEGATSIGNSTVTMIRARQSDGFVAVATHGTGIFTATVNTTTSVGGDTPDVLFLEQNYPNPCADKTTIGMSIPQARRVTLTVHDAFGAPVLTPVDGTLEAGYHTLPVDTRSLAPGIYYVRLQADNAARTRLLTVVR